MQPAPTILDHRRRRRNTRDHWYTLELGAGVDFSRLTVVSAHGGRRPWVCSVGLAPRCRLRRSAGSGQSPWLRSPTGAGDGAQRAGWTAVIVRRGDGLELELTSGQLFVGDRSR